MGGRLAVGNDDDLPVGGRPASEQAARELQPGVDVREVLGDAPRRLVEVDADVDAGVEDADRFRGGVDQFALVEGRSVSIEADDLGNLVVESFTKGRKRKRAV